MPIGAVRLVKCPYSGEASKRFFFLSFSLAWAKVAVGRGFMEGKGLQLGAVVPGPSNTNPGTSSVMLPVKLSDWAINLTLDESGNLMLDVARAGFTMHKIFYCNGNYDISNAVPASEETMEEVVFVFNIGIYEGCLIDFS